MFTNEGNKQVHVHQQKKVGSGKKATKEMGTGKKEKKHINKISCVYQHMVTTPQVGLFIQSICYSSVAFICVCFAATHSFPESF